MKNMPLYIILVLLLSCATSPKLSESDRMWLLLPQDFSGLFNGCTPVKATHNQMFFYSKKQAPLTGFSARYLQQFSTGAGATVTFTSQTAWLATANDAEKTMAGYFSIETKNAPFVKKIVPSEFGADDAILVQSDSLLYLAERKGLIVYFVQIDGLKANLDEVKNALAAKIGFMEKHPELFGARK
jgi:hypothetical protein